MKVALELEIEIMILSFSQQFWGGKIKVYDPQK